MCFFNTLETIHISADASKGGRVSGPKRHRCVSWEGGGQGKMSADDLKKEEEKTKENYGITFYLHQFQKNALPNKR